MAGLIRIRLARLTGAALWCVPAAWCAMLSVGLVGALEYAASSECGNPQFSLYLLAFISWPFLWCVSMALAWIVGKLVGEDVVRAERPLRHARLACPLFVAVFGVAWVILSLASVQWFPEGRGYDIRHARIHAADRRPEAARD